MKDYIFNLILSLSLLSIIECISIQLMTAKGRCFFKEYEDHDDIIMSYVISGENQENIIVTVYDPTQVVMFSESGKDEGQFTSKITNSGTYKLCFNATEPGDQFINFNIHGKFESGHLISVAKDGNIFNDLASLTDMQKELSQISSIFETMETNTKNIMERQEKHSNSIIKP